MGLKQALKALGNKDARRRKSLSIYVTGSLGKEVLDLINAQDDTWGGRSNLMKFALWYLAVEFGAVKIPIVDQSKTLEMIKDEILHQPRQIKKVKRANNAEIKLEETGW